jgi:PTH2 family peptidyl-tRNA hydrolase
MTKATKQVIIIRNDLNMRKGKMVAQGCHASMAVITSALNVISDDGETFGTFELNNAFIDWLNNSYTKICLQCNSEEELLDIHNKAKEANIITSLILDNGTTEFNGVKTYTAVAIGPDYSENIDKITKHLKLF